MRPAVRRSDAPPLGGTQVPAEVIPDVLRRADAMSGSALLRAVHAGGYRLAGAGAASLRARGAVVRACAVSAPSRRLVAANADTAYGRAHSFAHVHSLHDRRSRVPLVDYEALAPWVQRAASGERAVLTTAPVRIFERTSGSTGAGKLVPYTDALLGRVRCGDRPVAARSLCRLPRAGEEREATGRSHPPHASASAPQAAFQSASMMTRGTSARLRALRSGRCWRCPPRWHACATWMPGTPRPRGIRGGRRSRPGVRLAPVVFHAAARRDRLSIGRLLDAAEPRRAAEVRRRRTDRPLAEALWPRLAVVSCWMDGAAADALPAPRRAVPHATVQAKGLLATEGVVSLPLVLGGKSRCVGGRGRPLPRVHRSGPSGARAAARA